MFYDVQTLYVYIHKKRLTNALSEFLFFRYVSLIQPKQVLKEELDELRKHLEALNSPIVFCHNDPVLGNIIYNKQKGILSHSITKPFVSTQWV